MNQQEPKTKSKNGWIFVSIIGVVFLFMVLLVFLPLDGNDGKTGELTRAHTGDDQPSKAGAVSGNLDYEYALDNERSSGDSRLHDRGNSGRVSDNDSPKNDSALSVKSFDDENQVTVQDRSQGLYAGKNSARKARKNNQNQKSLARIQRELAETARADSIRQETYTRSLEEQHKINQAVYAKICGFLKGNL